MIKLSMHLRPEDIIMSPDASLRQDAMEMILDSRKLLLRLCSNFTKSRKKNTDLYKEDK